MDNIKPLKLQTIEEIKLRLELCRILKECAALGLAVDPKELPLDYLWTMFPRRASRKRPVL